MVYQNFPREFWSTTVAFDPFPSTDEPEKRPLKEFIIKFLVLNGQKPLTLDFNTFCSSIGLDYNNGNYVDHPTPEIVKKELGNIAINPSYLDKTLGPEALGALSKKSKRPKSKKPPTKTKARLKPCHVPRVTWGQRLRGNIPLAEMEPIHTPVADPLGIGAKYQTFADIQSYLLSEDELDKVSDEEEVLAAGDDMNEDIQAAKEVRTPSAKQDQSEPSNEHHEEATVSYVDLKASIDQYYDENIAHKDQTDKLVEAFMSSLDRLNTIISDLYKGLDVITQLLKDINNAVKDDPAANQKINESTESFARISSNINEVLSLVKGFDFSTLLFTVKDLQAHALKQEEASAAWTKQDTSVIKSIMTEIYQAFKGQPSSAPSSSVTLTLALTYIPANVEGENATNTATKEPPSHTEGENGDATMVIPISSIQPTHAQPITPIISPIISHPESSQATLRIDKGKRIETECEEDPLETMWHGYAISSLMDMAYWSSE
ncbi:hypothetical protein Tco_0542698 [Tanacetum coccineum]